MNIMKIRLYCCKG